MTTIRTSTRIVTLEVVARDNRGRPATGLSASDFQVFEQETGWRKEKREQKIAVFKPMGITEFTEENNQSLKVPDGVFSNLIGPQKTPVPPTVLLVDGLNTELTVQMQVHAQMVRMLRSLPSDTPVAVFLLGHRLRMVQSFTTDPSLLKAALQKASTAQPAGFEQIDPRDDPNALSAMEDLPPDILQRVQRFEQETYAATMDLRVQETLQALTAIARHVAGYPGRKSLLWVSSSFPLMLVPDNNDFTSFRQYQTQMQDVADILADAKIAVYPVDPGGVQTQSYFQAGTSLRDRAVSNPQDTLGRESQMRMNSQATMETVAEQTGGRICTNNNDLADCISKAINDSNAFYEIAYYPDSQNWNGNFRKIIVKTSQPGLTLSYRQGYFARSEGPADSRTATTALQKAGCEDYFNATSILLFARNLPSDSPEQLKYLVAVAPSTVTFVPAADGTEEVKITLAVCTFDKAGKPLQFMTEAVDSKLNPKEYQSVLATKGFPHVFTLVPKPRPASVRLLVKDESTGRIGSVNIPILANSPVVAAGKGGANASAPAPWC